MNADRPDHQSTALDAYIVGQLTLASRGLARHIDIEAQLELVLRTSTRTAKHNGAAAASDDP